MTEPHPITEAKVLTIRQAVMLLAADPTLADQQALNLIQDALNNTLAATFHATNTGADQRSSLTMRIPGARHP